MNWKLGLMRLWIVFAVIVVWATMVSWWPDIEREFDRAKGIDMERQRPP
jgi:hypothetical protein